MAPRQRRVAAAAARAESPSASPSVQRAASGGDGHSAGSWLAGVVMSLALLAYAASAYSREAFHCPLVIFACLAFSSLLLNVAGRRSRYVSHGISHHIARDHDGS